MGSKHTQRAYEEGKKGHNVPTTGLPYQDRNKIDAAVNQGKQDAGKKK